MPAIFVVLLACYWIRAKLRVEPRFRQPNGCFWLIVLFFGPFRILNNPGFEVGRYLLVMAELH